MSVTAKRYAHLDTRDSCDVESHLAIHGLKQPPVRSYEWSPTTPRAYCGCGRVFIVYTTEYVKCNQCKAEGRRRHIAEQKRGYRERDRLARAQQAPPCKACDGPLWPEDAAPTRVRSDRVTCSAKCRQALRRRRVDAQP